MGLIGSIIAGFLSRAIYDEAAGWSPKLSRVLIRLAVLTMPKLQQERCQEEWHAWLDELHGPASKITAALGFLVVAQRVNLCNFGAAGQSLFQTLYIERAYLTGYLSALQKVYTVCEIGQPVSLVGGVNAVSLYYIMWMRLTRVRNIAFGKDEATGITEISGLALQITMDDFKRDLKKKYSNSN